MTKRRTNRNHRANGDTRSTTERDLGYKHQKAKADALKAMPEGMPCPRCGLPMSKTQTLDLDHVIPRVLGGADGVTRLMHSSCNRSVGAAMGNRMRRTRRRPQKQKPRYPQW
jgi:5-methylcytosine-specific restriction endonuclease McrA